MADVSRRKVTYAVLAAGAIGLLIVAGATACTAMGANATGERLERIKESPQWNNAEGKFTNTLPREGPSFFRASWSWLTEGSDHREPETAIPVVPRQTDDFAEQPASGLRVTWFGHSSLLVEIDGKRVLVDPMWGERASPVSWAGPKRFPRPPMPLSALPELDAVVISHDHYDHLDLPTILELAERDVPFFVPLGVGAHLEYWGVPKERITELDWWQEHTVEDLRLVATPARHFSGRSLSDRDETLWAGWALIGPKSRAFYSGDGAFFPGFKDIGERLGPFDITMMETGAYNQLWPDSHMGPEQAVEAHKLVKGDVMIPVHWGTFDLSMHGWTAPIERVIAAAEKHDAVVAAPRPGESIEPSKDQFVKRWWPDVPFQSAKEYPIVSSGR